MKIIANNSSVLELNIFAKAYPDSDDLNDRKWINVELIIKLEGFIAHQYLQLYEDDILNFIDTINLFENGDSQTIEFRNMEEALYLKAVKVENDIHWEGYSIYPIGNGNKLEFRFTTPKDDLRLIKADLINNLKMISM